MPVMGRKREHRPVDVHEPAAEGSMHDMREAVMQVEVEHIEVEPVPEPDTPEPGVIDPDDDYVEGGRA